MIIRYQEKAAMRDGDGDGRCRETRDGKWVPCPPGTPTGTILKPGRLGKIPKGRTVSDKPTSNRPGTKPKTPNRPTTRPQADKPKGIDWNKAAPDQLLYQIPDTDDAPRFTTKRPKVDGDTPLRATTPPKNAADLSDTEVRKDIELSIADLFDDLDNEELTADERRRVRAARRAFEAAEDLDDGPARTRAMIRAFDDAIAGSTDTLGPTTGRKILLDLIERDAIVDVDDKGNLVASFAQPPKTVTAPANPRPFRPRQPSPPPLSGAAQDLATEADGDWGKFGDLLNKRGFVVFDYETTGFERPNTNRPVQIGAVRIKDGEVVERFNVFVNPGEQISDWSKDNLKDVDGNPLSDEWLSSQLDMTDAHRQLTEFLGDSIIVAHNLPFDQGVLDKMLAESGIDYTPAGSIDSLELARQIVPATKPDDITGPNGHSLANLTDFFGIDNSAWHTADGDAANTADVLARSFDFAADANIGPEPMDPEWQRKRFDEATAKYKRDSEQFKRDDAVWQADRDSAVQALTEFGNDADTPTSIRTGPPRQPTPAEENFPENIDELIRIRRAEAAERAAKIAERAEGFRTKEQQEEASRWYPEDFAGLDYDSFMQGWRQENPSPNPDDFSSNGPRASEDYAVALGDWRRLSLGAHTVEKERVVKEAKVRLRKIFGGEIVGKDGNPYEVRVKDVVSTYDGGLLMEGTIRGENGTIGEFRRTFSASSDGGIVQHDYLALEADARDLGVASAFNARNEGLYKLMGYTEIETEGASGSESGFIGATHWPKNGFDWGDSDSRNEFHAIIQDALDSYDTDIRNNPDEIPTVEGEPLFASRRQREIVQELLKASEKARFDDEDRLVAGDLLHWPGAQAWFQYSSASITYRRQL